MQIAPGIRRIGSGLVNAYLLEESAEVTLIDPGAPAYWDELPLELEAMGRSLEDLRAVVLTHGHSDHVGFAERARRERGLGVRVHELDAALARREVPNPAKRVGPMRLRSMLGFLVSAMRLGLVRVPGLREVITYGHGATLDVPGAPQVVHMPGHTPGSAALHVPTRDAIFIGDAIATYSVTTGRRGPQLSPFLADPPQALASLERLHGIDARYVLPGHGEMFDEGVAEAVRMARRAAAEAA
jgi:glyoxylase-like metal-dependent hydrolase (beta-lactamase superfamily II)